MIELIVNITAFLSKNDSENINRTLELRYLLVDTIEERNLGTIINEGTGKGFIDVSFVTKNYKEKELKDLLLALGFSNYKIEVSDDF